MLTQHEQYLCLDREKLSCRKACRDLFKAHVDIDNQIRSATNGNYSLGNERFQEQIVQALGRRVIKAKAGRPKAKGSNK